MTQLAAAAARGGAATVAAQVARIGLQLASVVVLARLLTPGQFGLVAMVTAVIGVAELLRDFGLSVASVQAKDVSRAERGNLFWANTALGTACAVVAAALTPAIVALYDEPALTSVVPPLAAVFVLSGMTTQYRADLARHLRFGTVAAADLAGPAAGIAAAIALGAAGAGVWALVAQQLVGAATTLVVVVAAGRWWPGRYRRDVTIRRFFKFGAAVLGTQLLSYVTRNVDNVVLGAVRGPTDLGLYSRAYQLVMVPVNQINAPLTNVAVPVLARVQDDVAALTAGLRRAQLVACYVTVPVLGVVAALADPLVTLLLGDQWTQVPPILAVLALGGIFRAVAQIAYWAYLATGRTSQLLRLQLWTQPIMIVLVAGGVVWGPVGVAAGHLVANVLYWVVSLVAVGRATGVAVRPLVTTALVAVVAVGLPAGAAAWAVAQTVDGALVQVLLGVAAAGVAAVVAGLVVPRVRRDAATMWRTARLVVAR